jgi:hypothetical protein
MIKGITGQTITYYYLREVCLYHTPSFKLSWLKPRLGGCEVSVPDLQVFYPPGFAVGLQTLFLRVHKLLV